MSEQIEITAELRQDTGKGASRRLRRQGEKVPGIIYGADNDPQSLTLQVNQLAKAMQQEAFYSQILNVVVDGDGQQAVVRDLQRHPSSNKVMHIDFLRLGKGARINVEVEVRFVGEEESPGLKRGGVLNVVRYFVELIANGRFGFAAGFYVGNDGINFVVTEFYYSVIAGRKCDSCLCTQL